MYSRYHRIDTCNMVNGTGLRTVIWFSGCPHHCKGCFSPQTWNPCGGVPFDFEAYCEIHDKAQKEYHDEKNWVKKSIINVAKSGFFSSDRTIDEYNDKIWKLEKLK